MLVRKRYQPSRAASQMIFLPRDSFATNDVARHCTPSIHAALPAPRAARLRPFLTRVESVALAIYVMVLAVGTWIHVFWRDEAQAWLIARDSSSIPELLHNLRYEGHPPLWHLILYAITRLTWNVEWMKLPNFVSAVGAAILIVRGRSLPIFVRVGLLFSYYLLFEYGMLARNYMLGVLLLIAASTLMRRDRPSLRVPILLSLASLSSLPAALVAMCLFLLYGSRSWAWYQEDPQRLRVRRNLWPQILLAAAFGVCLIFAALIVRPPADSGVLAAVYRPNSVVKWTSWVGYLLGRSYLPLPAFRYNFWDDPPGSTFIRHATAVFGFAAAAVFAAMLRTRSTRWFFIGSTALLVAELVTSGRVSDRHIGWLFVLLVCALILNSRGPVLPALRTRIGAWLLYAVIVGQAYAALFAAADSMLHPFSPARQVASFLRSHRLDNAILVPAPPYQLTSVLAYLGRPDVTDWNDGHHFSFVTWTRREAALELKMPDKTELHAISQGEGTPVVITGRALAADEQAAMDVAPLAAFNSSICVSEHFFLYKLNRPAQTPGSP